MAMQNRNVLEDVIPELDENLTTIVSMRGDRDKKPTVHDVFGTSSQPASAPIDIPKPSTEFVPSSNPTPTEPTSDPSSNLLLRAERPTKLLSTSVPSTKKGKFELRSVISETMPPPSEQPTEEGDNTLTVTASVDSSLTLSSSPVEADHKLEPATPPVQSPSNDSMDDIQLRKQKSSSVENLAKKLAKTFGMKGKSPNEEENKGAEVHLLSDISSSKDTEEESEQGGSQ
jgi:hypothetical protein